MGLWNVSYVCIFCLFVCLFVMPLYPYSQGRGLTHRISSSELIMLYIFVIVKAVIAMIIGIDYHSGLISSSGISANITVCTCVLTRYCIVFGTRMVLELIIYFISVLHCTLLKKNSDLSSLMITFNHYLLNYTQKYDTHHASFHLIQCHLVCFRNITGICNNTCI